MSYLICVHGKEDKVVSMVSGSHILICLHLKSFLHDYESYKSKKLRFR